MIRDEIIEYPYSGIITRIVEGSGREQDTTIIVYDGAMDMHMVTDEEGRTLQTSSYIVSIPLIKDDEGKWCIPHKGDKIEITRYDELIELTVDNSEPSQLMGVSIYASRNNW